MLKGIIIDDEIKAANYLSSIIKDMSSDIEILEVITDPLVGLDYLTTNKVDLVFLDIEMPRLSGLDLLNKIQNPSFEIIFVTGYDRYAIQAFNFCAIGYILKPVDEEDLVVALNNARQRISEKQSYISNKVLLENLRTDNSATKKIGIQTSFGLEFILLTEIIRCEALQKVTKIVTKNRELISSYNIGYFNKLLEEYNFFQVHKSHLINLDGVSTLDKNGFVHTEDNFQVPVARRRKAEFLNRMSKL